MSELDQLTRLCVGLGAPPDQAAIMAAQLFKRCDQLVASRGLTREAAMRQLLTLVTQGSQGQPPPGFEGVAPPTSPPPPSATD